jgi:hypothetical protein
MYITEKQLLIMFRVLEGSLNICDRTDMNIFGYDREVRKTILHQIINQQSDELIEVKE